MSDEDTQPLLESEVHTTSPDLNNDGSDEIASRKQNTNLIWRKIVKISLISLLAFSFILSIICVVLYFGVVPPMLTKLISDSELGLENISFSNPTDDSIDMECTVKVVTNSTMTAQIHFINATVWAFNEPLATCLLPSFRLEPLITSVNLKTTLFFIGSETLWKTDDLESLVTSRLVGHMSLTPHLFPFKFTEVPFNKTVHLFNGFPF